MVESFAPVHQKEAEGGLELLTPRERDVLERLTLGETYAEVAAGLGLSLSTVQGHVRSIYGKLEVNSKAEATRRALQAGWGRK